MNKPINSIASVVFIVKDAIKAAETLLSLSKDGKMDTRLLHGRELKFMCSGKEPDFKCQCASVTLEGLKIEFVQPLPGESSGWSECMAKYGHGVAQINVFTDNAKEAGEEMVKQGYKNIQSGVSPRFLIDIFDTHADCGFLIETLEKRE